MAVLNADSGVQPGEGRDGSRAYVGPTTTHAKGGALCDLSAIPFQEGRDYRVSVWIRGDAPQLSAWLYYYPSSGDSLRFKTTTQWQRQEAVIRFPAGVYDGKLARNFKLTPKTGGILRLFTGYTPEPGGRVFFDDLTVELLPPRLDAVVKALSNVGRLEVTVNTAGFEEQVDRHDLRVTARILGASDHADTGISRTVAATEPVSRLELEVNRLPAGRYVVRTRLATAGGEELAVVEQPYESLGLAVDAEAEAASWQANHLGVLDPRADAPRPWTNLETNATTVRCWGRAYELGAMTLPARITALDQDILAAPIALSIVPVGGTLGDARPRIVSQSAQRVVAESVAAGGGVAVAVTSEIEFDGMMRVTVEMTPKTPNASVASMTLDIPLDERVARYVMAYNGEGKAEDCRLDPARPFVHEAFNYHIWIGDEERGLAWFAEEDAGWHVKTSPCFQTFFADGRVTLRINMIDSPTRLEQPTRIVFGLQATPVKPRRSDWTNYLYRTKTGENCNVTWPRATFQKYMGFPEAPDDPAKWQAMLRARRYELPLVYVNYLHDQHPFYRYYEDRLEAPGTVFDIETGTDYKGRERPVKAYLPLWKDFLTRALDQYIRRWNLQGLYHDCWDPPIDSDGRMHLWDSRDLVKRIYLMHRAVVPDAITIVHSSSRLMPCVSFVDVVLYGEQVRSDLIRDGYYLSVMDLEQFRVEFGVVDVGVHPMFLPQFKLAWGEDAARGLHAAGLCFLHDMTMWVSFMNREPFDVLEPVWRDWRAKGGFHPYWKRGEPGFAVDFDDETTAVSYYQSEDGVLLVVVNTTGDEQTAAVKLDLAALGLGADARVKIHDYLGEPAPAHQRDGRIEADGTITVPMVEFDAQLIEVLR